MKTKQVALWLVDPLNKANLRFLQKYMEFGRFNSLFLFLYKTSASLSFSIETLAECGPKYIAKYAHGRFKK